jgi:hypothetical protein
MNLMSMLRVMSRPPGRGWYYRSLQKDLAHVMQVAEGLKHAHDILSMLSNLTGVIRVHIEPEGESAGRVDVLQYDDPNTHLQYDKLEDMPEWMQRRIATLRVFPPDPYGPDFPTVGRRLGDDVFWLYPDPSRPEETWP